LSLPLPAAEGLDWPCWRGPNRDGITEETGWTWQWGSNGPAVLWKAALGKGFSSFAVAGGRLYALGNTNKTDTVFCRDAANGTVLWRHSYPCDPQPLSYEGGPSATPAAAGGRVYTFSKEGHLFCLDAQTGKAAWSRKFDLWPRQEGDWQNTWRYAGSPLVIGSRLYISVGKAGTALDTKDGATLWQSPEGHPGYSSPVPFASEAGPALAFFSGHGVHGVEASSGKPLWRAAWNTLWDLNAADPIVRGARLFVSSGNGTGCALFDLAQTPPAELWRNKNLKTLMNGPVLWQGLLFGFNDTHLSCVSWTTGEELWMTRDLRKGSLIVAGGKLVLLSETGKLAVAEATDRGYEALAQAQILSGRCWTTPVLSHGLLYARNANGDMVCLDLRKKSP